jgi:hypothetical protein
MFHEADSLGFQGFPGGERLPQPFLPFDQLQRP